MPHKYRDQVRAARSNIPRIRSSSVISFFARRCPRSRILPSSGSETRAAAALHLFAIEPCDTASVKTDVSLLSDARAPKRRTLSELMWKRQRTACLTGWPRNGCRAIPVTELKGARVTPLAWVPAAPMGNVCMLSIKALRVVWTCKAQPTKAARESQLRG
ncbi:hypothetical protein FVE85_9732 [Porphyridium purpureum]|uniref:Uncharacterized protein n=1 Tax=Porphyridium purpureum TaxID=35688 RepID=A0A5J4YKN7_PORPP|nr:hypothetical protein FVE85_9732 [Porphyridium purpureum]|eukprot:POR3078..scf246_12